jgi:inhibitor of KinA sporulation pathway (predicted exonuclease)
MSDRFWGDLSLSRTKLFESKLGELLTWQAPAIAKTVGPFDPTIFVNFGQKCRAAMEACHARLKELSDEKVEAILSDDKREQMVWRDWDNFHLREISHLSRTIPAWHAGGFGHPDHIADFVYWAKMPRFSIVEVACLAAGVEPNDLTPEKLKQSSRLHDVKPTPALVFLHRQIELIARQFDPHQHKATVDPRNFLKWIDRVELEVHPEFLRLLQQYHPTDASPASKVLKTPEPHKREIDTIAQLFTALAIDALGYDPTQLRSPIPKEISGIAAKLGLAGTDDSVRKYLRIGAKFLPEGWRDD